MFPIEISTSGARKEGVIYIEELRRDVSLTTPQLRYSAKLHRFNFIATSQNGSHVTGVKTANRLRMEVSSFRGSSHDH